MTTGDVSIEIQQDNSKQKIKKGFKRLIAADFSFALSFVLFTYGIMFRAPQTMAAAIPGLYFTSFVHHRR